MVVQQINKVCIYHHLQTPCTAFMGKTLFESFSDIRLSSCPLCTGSCPKPQQINPEAFNGLYSGSLTICNFFSDHQLAQYTKDRQVDQYFPRKQASTSTPPESEFGLCLFRQPAQGQLDTEGHQGRIGGKPKVHFPNSATYWSLNIAAKIAKVHLNNSKVKSCPFLLFQCWQDTKEDR